MRIPAITLRTLATCLCLTCSWALSPLATAEESCDPNQVNRTVLMIGERLEQNNAGCVMICYRLLRCQQGCGPTQDSWYEIEDGAAAQVPCPPARPTTAQVCI